MVAELVMQGSAKPRMWVRVPPCLQIFMDDPDVIAKHLTKNKPTDGKTPMLVKVSINDEDDFTWSWNVYEKDTFFPALNKFMQETK